MRAKKEPFSFKDGYYYKFITSEHRTRKCPPSRGGKVTLAYNEGKNSADIWIKLSVPEKCRNNDSIIYLCKENTLHVVKTNSNKTPISGLFIESYTEGYNLRISLRYYYVLMLNKVDAFLEEL